MLFSFASLNSPVFQKSLLGKKKNRLLVGKVRYKLSSKIDFKHMMTVNLYCFSVFSPGCSLRKGSSLDTMIWWKEKSWAIPLTYL